MQRALAAVQEEVCWLIPPDAETAAPPAGGQLTPAQTLLLDLVAADSAAVVRGGQVYRIGDAPGELTIYAIAAMFGRDLPDIRATSPHAFATDSLAASVPAAVEVKDRAAGVLAVPLALDRPDYLLFFRGEQVVLATWAGNPADTRTEADGTNPRASFAAWKRDIRNLSRSWEIEDVQVAHELAQAVREIETVPPRAAAPVASPRPPMRTPGEPAPVTAFTRRIVRISSP